MATFGTIRSRFRVLSREFCSGGFQTARPVTWCVFQCPLGSNKGRLLELNRTLQSRRLVGSYLDIKKHYRKQGTHLEKYKNLPVIHINASFNNTVITISDKKGKTLGWVSAGTEGFNNARRGSSTAGRQAGIAAAYKAISLGVESARIKVCGIGTGRQGAINGIDSAGVRVVSVTDVTPVPHNGCRPRKTRRL